MKPTFDQKLISAFMLNLDNRLLSRGQAFQNWSGLFYSTTSDINGLYTYTAPFQNLVNDTSISGATVMSGIYLNGNPITIGTSGLVSINHFKGALYFNQSLPSNTIISGNYSIKDFGVHITDKPEYELLFDTAFSTNGEYAQTLTGLSLEDVTAPVIYLRTKANAAKPFAFGALEDKTKTIRAIIIASNEFQRLGASNILCDMLYSPFYCPLSLPFDTLGNYTGVNYSYTGLSFDNSNSPWIMSVKASDVPRAGDFKPLPYRFSFVDFEISTILTHTY
jgi:hypothetical protein